MDPLKRSIFPQPVYLRSGDVTQAWHDRRRHTDEIIASVYQPRDQARNLEGQFVSDVYTHSGSGQSRFSDWVVDHFSGESTSNGYSWRLLILFWLVVVRPARYVVTRIIYVYSILYWLWRYRRFIWWRAKEKLGWVSERHYNWTDAHWAEPGISLVCPVFTLCWMWRYRRFVWWRAKEKLGWEEQRYYDWHEWLGPGVSLVCPIFTIRWLWQHRRWLMAESKKSGFDMKHALGLLRAGHISNPQE
jgi:hypothetical protein